ncbi:MAG TPA: phosphotransferase [Candidatus Saccharimonadales bacterium]
MNLFRSIEDINFVRVVETAALTYTKELHELTYVEHGTDNIVAMANRRFVFRFPRDEKAARRLVFETALLQKIKGKITALPIPELLEVHTRPLYIVTKYIEGNHLSPSEIQQLNEAEQAKVGTQLADFMFQMNQAISGLEVRRLRSEANVDLGEEPWPQYFNRLFAQQPLPNDKLAPIVKEYFETWKQFVGGEQQTFTIHDDLNPNNMLFVGAGLSGILDFGDTNTGSIESELRKLYGCGEIVLKAAVDRYESLSGATIQYDHIRIWAVIHDLARFTDRLSRQDTDSTLFNQAHENLRNWIPGFPL